jgi:hypothetical protein
MTIKALYPNVRPSLDLNFARTKALDPRIAFTRASIGTFVGSDGLIKTAVNNTPRFDHNPFTGESLGFLMEDGRTNIGTYSEQFDNAAWVWNNGTKTVAANATIAPDGNFTADMITVDAGFTEILAPNSGLGGAKTFSIFLKAGTISLVNLRLFSGVPPNEATADFNLSSGTATVIQGASVTTAAIQAYPNGWYRCSITRTDASSVSGSNIRLNGSAGTFYAWGAQTEANIFATSYIPTSGTAATRAGEVASIQGSNFTNWFNASAGTFLCEWKSGSPANERILNFGTGGVATIISNEGVIGSGTYFSPLQIYPSSISGNGIKIAATTSISESAGAYNGNAVVSTGACSYYASASSLNFCPPDSGVRVNWYKKVTYWPSRLSNIQLQALTQ